MIALLLMALGCFGIAGYSIYKYRNEQNIANNAIDDFRSKMQNNNDPSPTNKPVDDQSDLINNENHEDQNDTDDNSLNKTPLSETIGVMSIPKISLNAPIALGTDEYTLKTHIGEYSTLDPLESEYGTTAFAAHSSVGTCGHCYFNRLEELEEGDRIYIEWNDGNTYEFSVYYVVAYEDKNQNYYYDDVEGQKTITLTTCTDGDPDVRTIVMARKEN